MIQRPSMSEALQRALMGLGDIGPALQDAEKTKAAIAATNAGTAETQARLPGVQADAQQKQLSFQGEMKKRQLLDALGGLEKERSGVSGLTPNDLAPGQAGPVALGANVLSDAGSARLQAIPKEHAALMATLARENGDATATPELMAAKANSALKQAQNAGTLSDQSVTAGQTANDTNAFKLGQDRTLAPFQATEAKNTAAASAYKPGQAAAQTRLANAEAGLKESMAANGGSTPQMVASAEHQAKERLDKAGKETGFDTVKDNWKNIQTAYTQAADPKVKDKSASDYALLDQYMKMVNPGMGVRASNMEMFANAMGMGNKIKAGMLKVQQGGKFDPEVRDAIKTFAEQVYKNHESSYLDKVNSIAEGLDATPGANRERVFGKSMNDQLKGTGSNSDPLGILQ